MKKIIILDFETQNIIIADFDTNIYDENQNITDFFDALGEVHGFKLSESNCQWIIVNVVNLKVL